MLPPIRNSTSESLTGYESNGISGGSLNHNSNNKRTPYARMASPNRVGHSENESNNRALAATGLDRMAERVSALESENETFRQDLHKLRHFYSTKEQQHDNEKLFIEKISEDLQRVAHAFNTKLEADTSLQQREQHKAAVLFAEVARLGHRVETLESEVRRIVEDTQRKFETQEQQITYVTKTSSNQQQIASPTRNAEVQRQLQDCQKMMVQLRTEFEADRSTRWKNDAAMDAKLDAQCERLHAKQSSDNQNILRTLDEQRQFVTGVDFQRVSSHMREFARVNDQLIVLERWVHHEFGQIKQVFQTLAGDVDARFQCVLLELTNGLKMWHAAHTHQEEDFGQKLYDLERAVRDIVVALQKKVCTLEQVVPLEVQARQKNASKFQKRVESVVNTLDHALKRNREENASHQSSVEQSIQELELSQQSTLAEITMQHASMRETVQTFMEDADATLCKVVTAVEQECIKGMQRVTARTTTPLEMLKMESAAETRRIRQELSALQARTMLLEQMLCHSQPKVDALQAWSTMHAQECRQFLDFLCCSMADVHREHAVVQCLDAVIVQIVETQACEQLNHLAKKISQPRGII